MAVKTSFKAGASSIGRIEVLTGLTAGQQIVISSSDVFEEHDQVMLLNR
jgi:hypothetical protein